jgi:hypothetical protein
MKIFTKTGMDDDEKVITVCVSIFVIGVIIFLGWLIWHVDHIENTPDVGDIVAFKTNVPGGATDGIVVEVVGLTREDMYTISYKGQDGKIYKILSRKKDLVILKKY